MSRRRSRQKSAGAAVLTSVALAIAFGAGVGAGATTALRGGIHRTAGVHFLRIQKTGGTTFGEHVARRFCGPESDVCKWASHLDYSSALEGWGGRVVTLLRDPVERTMSEFAFIRTKGGNYSCRQAQWDFRNFTWFDSIVNEPDEDRALQTYLHGYRDNPSRNRQALYLLGFKKMVGGAPVPEYTYDWDADHATTLEEAKRHLDALTAFGITDCYLPSMRVLARELGWPEESVLEMARTTHARQVRTSRHWRDTVSRDVVQRIEVANAVDMELLDFARQRLYERFGITCSGVES